MENVITLDFPTRKLRDLLFEQHYTFSLKEIGFSDEVSYEDKILVERALEDFRSGRVSSRKKIMRFLDE